MVYTGYAVFLSSNLFNLPGSCPFVCALLGFSTYPFQQGFGTFLYRLCSHSAYKIPSAGLG